MLRIHRNTRQLSFTVSSCICNAVTGFIGFHCTCVSLEGALCLQTKVRGSKSENDFGDAIGQTDGATAAVAHEATPDTATTATAPLLPEEKVPL